MKKTTKIFRATALLVLTAMLSIVFMGCPGNGKTPSGGSGGSVTKYTVTFDANGGAFADGSTSKEKQVAKGKAVEELTEKPVWKDHIFMGWYERKDGSGTAYNFSKPVTKSFTLYAKWTEAVTITFDANGGAFADGKASKEKQVAKGETVANLTEKPIRAGYTFVEWLNESGEKQDFPITVIKNIRLTAKWKPHTYTVHFDGNGADSGSMDDQSFEYDEAKRLSKNEFVKNGYDFKGWSKTKNGSKAYSDEERISNLTDENNKTITLYAKWGVKQYTVSFDSKGGSPVSSKTVDYGVKVQKPSDPTRTGYTFVEWAMKVV